MTDTSPVISNDASAENKTPSPLQSLVEMAVEAVADTDAQAPTLQAPTMEAQAGPNPFAELGLAAPLVQAAIDLGYTAPTQVQMQVIPLALPSAQADGAKNNFIDLMVSSQTGSGKTAAFLLPVLHTLLERQAQAQAKDRAEWDAVVAAALAKGEPAPKRPKRKDPTNARHFKAATPGALVLCPTRELAQQVAHDAIDLVRHCQGLRVANVVGGMPYQLQIAKLQNADLVVATPGRLLDLQRSQQIKLDQVKFLVVDEADRMLDLGFSDDLAELNQLTIGRQQTMMFSATFAPRIQQLASRVMRTPQKIQIDSPQEKHANIKQVLFWADNAQHKRQMLDHWLRDTTIDQAIVFASTQVECDGLATDLQQAGFSAVALHGALSQGLRNRRLMALRNGQVQILVATDVAARGIDVPTITHVFNFGLPMKAEDYTHRIGRTGRAGRDGLAVTFAEFRDRRKIFDIEAYSKQSFKAEVLPGLEPKQRFPESRPGGQFGGKGRENREFGSRDRKFGGGHAPGGAGGGFRGKDSFRGDRDGGREGGREGGRDSQGYGRKPGFGDRPSFGDRPQFGARPGFGERTHFGGDRPNFGDRPQRPERAERGPRPEGRGGNFGGRPEGRPAGRFEGRPEGRPEGRAERLGGGGTRVARAPAGGSFAPYEGRKRTAR